MRTMILPDYLLGSGILDNPAPFTLLFLAVSGIVFICSLMWTIFLIVSSISVHIAHPKKEYVIGIVLSIVSYFLVGYLGQRYEQAIEDAKTEQASDENSVVWNICKDKYGNTCIYEIW